jgi:hypothetical protein
MAGFGDWLKGVGTTITTNLGDVLSNAAGNLFSGAASKAKADAQKTAAEAEAYKAIVQAQAQSNAITAGTSTITQSLNQGNMLATIINTIKKYWWVLAAAVAAYFLLGALKKKSKVKRRRRRKRSRSSKTRSSGNKPKSTRKTGKTRKFHGRSYPFATKQDKVKYMDMVRKCRK